MEEQITFIDLFAGIGGFRHAIENSAKELNVSTECLLSSDIDKHCQLSYETNFGEKPLGDISDIKENDIPDHDILLAGFPCQPFSIIGQMKGFEDSRGNLFFDIARILEAKRPRAFVLENVKLLKGLNQGKTLKRIVKTLDNLGYYSDYRVLNALNYGLPQKRERIFIVGFLEPVSFEWPDYNIPMKSLDEILEDDIPPKYFVSEHIRKKRLAKHAPTKENTIWHENKAGNIGVYPYSCALRAGASYNYLLVNGVRRLTSREMLRLQGFPDSFKIVSSYTQTRKQVGNSLPIPMAQAVIKNVLISINSAAKSKSKHFSINNQRRVMEDTANLYAKTS